MFQSELLTQQLEEEATCVQSFLQFGSVLLTRLFRTGSSRAGSRNRAEPHPVSSLPGQVGPELRLQVTCEHRRY